MNNPRRARIRPDPERHPPSHTDQWSPVSLQETGHTRLAWPLPQPPSAGAPRPGAAMATYADTCAESDGEGLSGGRFYELWYIAHGQTVPLLAADPTAGDKMGLSVEPAGGTS